jgi:hypothetical protein
MLILVCYVRGDDWNQAFHIKIGKSEPVSALKKAIKEEKRPKFDEIPADSLSLWKVSVQYSKTLEKDVEALNLVDDDLLQPLDTLSDIFSSDLEKKSVHIIINRPLSGELYVKTIFSFEPPFTPLEVTQTVAALNLSQIFSLNCFVVGDDPDRMFTVEVEKTKNVSILKDLIKEKKAPHLNHVAASDLDLWKVDVPIDDLPTKNFLTDGPKLGSGELLLDVFPSELNIRFIHVTVCVPVRSECYMYSWYNFAHYSVIRGCR